MKKNIKGAKELAKYKNINLTLNTDAKELNFWTEAHKQHKQEGPDILTITAPGHSLKFKTMIEPGPEIGFLSFKIAGEVIKIHEMSFAPEDWKAFSDKLAERNAGIAAGMYIKETLQKQRAASEKERLEYEKTGDPQIIIKYIKKSRTGAALQEPWIIEALKEWKRTDQHDFIIAAFSRGPGENKGQGKRAIENMMFVDRIDRIKNAGQTLTEAFITEIERTGGGDLTGKNLDKKLTSLKNKYNRAKKIEPEVTIQETAESLTMTAFPGKVTIGDSAIFGTWKIKQIKK